MGTAAALPAPRVWPGGNQAVKLSSMRLHASGSWSWVGGGGCPCGSPALGFVPVGVLGDGPLGEHALLCRREGLSW